MLSIPDPILVTCPETDCPWSANLAFTNTVTVIHPSSPDDPHVVIFNEE